MAQAESDLSIISRNFQRVFGRLPDLANPVTFNEKVIYKMIYDRRPLLTRLTDKLRARDYVAERIGREYLPTLYQSGRSLADLDWEELPQRFMIKASHGSGMTILVYNKSPAALRGVGPHVKTWVSTNFYYNFREWAYRDIEPAVIAEEVLTEPNGALASDWKFYTFDGRAEFLAVNVDQSNERKVSFYDRNLTRLPLTRGRPSLPAEPTFPDNIDLMFRLADRLGAGLDFVRVDMYNVGGRIAFGEFTSYPDAGLAPFEPSSFDTLFGSKWRVPVSYS